MHHTYINLACCYFMLFFFSPRLHDLREVAIVVRHFAYQGEGVRTARGTLAAVTAQVAQVSLPTTLTQALTSELDTGGSAARLLRVLETAAQVVGNGYGGSSSSSGGGTLAPMARHAAAAEADPTLSEDAQVVVDKSSSMLSDTIGSHRGVAMDPHTLLTSLVEGVLLVPSHEWAALCPLAVRRGATLQHMRDLLLAVEARSLGHLSPAHGIADKFKQPIKRSIATQADSGKVIADSIAEEWAAALKALPSSPVDRATCLGPVLGAFRDLLAGPLADPSDFSATESLRLFLSYQNDDLLNGSACGNNWFSDKFPESLRLEHALEVYLALAATA